MTLDRPIPDLDPVAHRTLSTVLERHLCERPDDVAVLDETGELTYRELYEASLTRGAGLLAAGVAPDEPVLLMLDNHLDFVTTWVGLCLVGGVEVPVNTAYRGRILAHVGADSGARVAVIDAEYLDRLVAIAAELPALSRVFVRGSAGPLPEVAGWTLRPFDELDTHGRAEPRDARAWERMGILYTSGTTGNSKGVTAPHGLAYSYSSPPWIEPGERIMVNLPLFHIGGQWAGVYAAWIAGGAAVIVPRFSATTFWDDVRRFGCNQTLMLGAMASFLWSQPRRPDDADNPMRYVNMVPVVPDHDAFAERFGLAIGTAYGMTEFSSPVLTPYGKVVPGVAGRVRDDYEARIVDEDDLEVEPGRTGEMVLRARVPWANMAGYHNLPVETQHAWRNLWFHTGDAMRTDEQGRLYFVDRVNDALRVRGENVSSFEVEAEVVAHPDVAACAVVAVASEHTEDEIKAVVVAKDGATVDPVALLELLVERLPYFMVPRYLEFRAELPTTPTQKIKKAELRAEGVTDQTWDRERHGYRVTRQGLQRPSAAAT